MPEPGMPHVWPGEGQRGGQRYLPDSQWQGQEVRLSCLWHDLLRAEEHRLLRLQDEGREGPAGPEDGRKGHEPALGG